MLLVLFFALCFSTDYLVQKDCFKVPNCFTTLVVAFRDVKSGDRILIKSSSFPNNVVSVNESLITKYSGTPDHPIIVMPFYNDRVQINGTKDIVFDSLIVFNNPYWSIMGGEGEISLICPTCRSLITIEERLTNIKIKKLLFFIHDNIGIDTLCNQECSELYVEGNFFHQSHPDFDIGKALFFGNIRSSFVSNNYFVESSASFYNVSNVFIEENFFSESCRRFVIEIVECENFYFQNNIIQKVFYKEVFRLRAEKYMNKNIVIQNNLVLCSRNHNFGDDSVFEGDFKNKHSPGVFLLEKGIFINNIFYGNCSTSHGYFLFNLKKKSSEFFCVDSCEIGWNYFNHEGTWNEIMKNISKIESVGLKNNSYIYEIPFTEKGAMPYPFFDLTLELIGYKYEGVSPKVDYIGTFRNDSRKPKNEITSGPFEYYCEFGWEGIGCLICGKNWDITKNCSECMKNFILNSNKNECVINYDETQLIVIIIAVISFIIVGALIVIFSVIVIINITMLTFKKKAPPDYFGVVDERTPFLFQKDLPKE